MTELHRVHGMVTFAFQDHQNLISYFSSTNNLSIQVWLTSLPGSEDSMPKKADIYVLYWIVTLKVGQGHQNLINCLLCPRKTIYRGWPESIVQFKR